MVRVGFIVNLNLMLLKVLRYFPSKWLRLIFLFPSLKLLPESLQQPGMFALPKEFGLLESLIEELDFFRIIRVVIVGDPGLVVLLGDHFVSEQIIYNV